MVEKNRTVKRITKVLIPDKMLNDPPPSKHFFHFKGTESYQPLMRLATKFSMQLEDWERLGKPKKVRVTISVVDDDTEK